MSVHTFQNNKTLQELLGTDKGFVFFILTFNLFLSSFRPDRLLPGGEIVMYLPQLLQAVLLLLWLFQPNKQLGSPQTKLLIAFTLLMILQVPLSRNAAWSFHQVKSFIFYIVTAYFIKVQFLDTPHRISTYLRLAVLLSLFFAFLGITGQGKVSIPVLRDENDFCLFMNTLIPFAYFFGQEAKTTWKKGLYYGAAAVFVLGNIISFSRGGFVGLAAVGLYLLHKSQRKMTGIVIIGMLSLVIIVAAPSTYWGEIESIKTENIAEGTGKERIESWKAGWKMFLDHPLMGVGSRNYGIWLPDYYPYNPSKMWGRVAHSFYFTLLPEMGLIGTLMVAGMLWHNYKAHRYICTLEKEKELLTAPTTLPSEEKAQIYDSIRTLHFLSLSYTGALIAYLVTGIFISVLWYHYLWIYTAYFVTTANMARNLKQALLSLQPDTTERKTPAANPSSP